MERARDNSVGGLNFGVGHLQGVIGYSRRGMKSLPLDQIETVFLDAGNTLVSIDFAWVARELGALGLQVAVPALRRAEAAARPAVSARVAVTERTEGSSSFSFYIRAVLERLPQAPDAAEGERLARGLERVLVNPGNSDRLWCEVMPGVPEALERFRALGLQRIVVSNADGSVERGLTTAGLRLLLDDVVDSQVVGFEKPDRRIFDIALERSGARPETTLHVGDLYAADVVGARAAGCHALLLDPWGDWPDMGCAKLPDLSAVADALAGAR